VDYTQPVMPFYVSKFGFTCLLFVALVFSYESLFAHEPIELIPVDGGVVDRGALNASLLVQQSTFRQDNAFEKLYRVSGSNDIYVRKSGGLIAVFRHSEYKQTPAGEIPIVPAGTVYCIGEISPRMIRQIGELQEPHSTEVIPDSMIQAELVTVIKPSVVMRKQPKQPKQHTFEFLENEAYRRQRLASFVIEIVLLN